MASAAYPIQLGYKAGIWTSGSVLATKGWGAAERPSAALAALNLLTYKAVNITSQAEICRFNPRKGKDPTPIDDNGLHFEDLDASDSEDSAFGSILD